MPDQNQPISVTKSDLHQHWQKRLEGSDLHSQTTRLKDADYFEVMDESMDPDTIIYETTIKQNEPEEGRLVWGNMVLYPGKVNDEYFCTRGHAHANPHTEEYILCMDGDGLLMLLDDEGNCWAEELEEGSLHHIPEGLSRRVINLGDRPVYLSFCRPANAPDLKGEMKGTEFPCRIYDGNGEMAIKVDIPEQDANDDHSVEDIEAILKM